MKNRNVLVTGGAGFIGCHLVARLVQQGAHVRVVDDFSTGDRRNLDGLLERIDLIEGSLTDATICRRAVEDIEIVFHQAALPSVQRSVADPVTTDRANVGALVQLLTAAKDARVGRFIYASSSSAYGDVEGSAKHEELPPQPLSPYAASKLAGEHYCRAFYAVYGVETISLRYFNVFGPNQDPASPYSAVIPIFITAALDRRPPTIFGDGRQSRDFTYVENVVHANLLAARAPLEAIGHIFNIACGRSIDLLTLIAVIERILGTRIEPEFAPPRPGDIRHSLADLSKARRLLGYEPIVTFEEGLKRTIEWYKAHRDRW